MDDITIKCCVSLKICIFAVGCNKNKAVNENR